MPVVPVLQFLAWCWLMGQQSQVAWPRRVKLPGVTWLNPNWWYLAVNFIVDIVYSEYILGCFT